MLSTLPSALGADEVVLRLGVAAGLGAAIGFERELRERGAGLRTHLLVSVGAALFTLVSTYGFREFGTQYDPSRVAAQIVSGIGFLGAGAIIRQGFSIRGLTTAATLWLVAAIGMASGAGYWSAALIATGGALLSLGPLRVIGYRVTRRFRTDTGRLLVQLPAGESPAGVVDAVDRFGARIESMEVSHEGERRQLDLVLQLHNERAAPQLVASVADVESVLEVQWTE